MTEMERQINEISKDIFEIESLLNVSRRQRIKNFLSLELRKLISEKRQLEESFRDEKTSEAKKNRDPLDVKNVRVKIDNYAWDQSPKYVKFFLTLKKVHQLDSEDIKCQFGSDSLSLTVKNLENKDYFFDIQKLLHPIAPEKSYWRVKSDTILIFLVKSSALKWPFLTRIEEESASKKNNKYGVDKTEKHDENSLFSLVKDMYEKGDDRLKRTIAQAWTEGQSSKGYM